MSSIKWRRPDKPLKCEDISKIEELFSICFPKDYVECVQNYHGASVIPYRIDLNGNVRVLANLLSFADDSVDNITKAYFSNKDRFKDGIFPFACDPSGNYFCFDYREDKNNPSVIFWNHELAVNAADYSQEQLKRINLSDTQEKAMERVCSSFTELLSMLHA